MVFRMTTTNAAAPPVMPVQNQTPIITDQSNTQNFPVRTFKALGGVQIGIGVLLGLLSIIGVIFDSISLHKDCNNDYWYGWTCWGRRESAHELFALDITCLICAGWYILTGFLPLCMSRKRENTWKGLKIGFMVCSIIGASIFAPTTFSLGVAGAVKRGEYERRVVVLSAFMAVLSFVELVVAIISASYCCCCSQWNTRKPVSVMYMNTSQPGMLISIPQTQIPVMTFQPNAVTGQPVNTMLQNPRAQQYQVIATNQPMPQQFQTVNLNQPGVITQPTQFQTVNPNQPGVITQQSQIVHDDSPPAYKERL